MKIRNILLSATSLLLLSGCNQKTEPEKNFALSKCYKYMKSSRSDEWASNGYDEYIYNDKGECIEEKYYTHINGLDVLEENAIRVYDDNGNEISYDSREYDSTTGEVSYRYGLTFENYDANGNYGKETIRYYEEPWVEPRELSVTNYEYDENGSKTKEFTDTRVINYEYYSNGNLKTKYFSEIEDGETELFKKIEYTYYENSNLQKDISTYWYENGAYEATPSDRHHFEYDENGFMTLYEIYESEVKYSSLEYEFTSDVSYKETNKCVMPDVGFSLCYIDEYTYSNHEAMMNADENGLLSVVDCCYDLYESPLPYSKSIDTYIYENGLEKEFVREEIYYEDNSEVERSYYAFKEVFEYIEM